MANSWGIAGFVIWITVLAQKLAQYPAGECRGKIMQVSARDSIHRTTSRPPPDRYQFSPALKTAARNTWMPQDLPDGYFVAVWRNPDCTRFAQAGDGFATRWPMISKA